MSKEDFPGWYTDSMRVSVAELEDLDKKIIAGEVPAGGAGHLALEGCEIMMRMIQELPGAVRGRVFDNPFGMMFVLLALKHAMAPALGDPNSIKMREGEYISMFNAEETYLQMLTLKSVLAAALASADEKKPVIN